MDGAEINERDSAVENGIELLESGRAAEAVAPLAAAVATAPGDAAARFNLGLAYERSGQVPAAKEEYRKALALNPGHEGALNNLANLVSRGCGELDECLRLAEAAVAANPAAALAWAALGGLQLQAAQPVEAVQSYERALNLRADAELGACRLFSMGYLPDATMDGIFQEHRRWRADFAAALENAPPLARPIPLGGRELRVGYVSSDFRRHSVAYFIEPVLHCHDRSRFEVFCYSDVRAPDEVTRRIQSMPLAWRDIRGLDDDAAARLVADDRLDVLIDLNGHTGRRLLLFARRPAPTQGTWLGYPFTTGLDAIEFRVTDAWADPPGQEAFHSETLLRIPGGFNVFAPPGTAPECGSPPCGKSGVFTFASFNNLSKINSAVVRVWGRILHGAPRARLLLKNSSLECRGVRGKIISQFEAVGARPGQVLVSPYTPRLNDHMAAYAEADAALDTFPYNGVTTTCEALWMGVPVITLVGDRHCGRTGLSMLSRMGLDWFCAKSEEDYINKAIILAQSPEMAASLRPVLRPMMAERLCDAAGFTSRWEAELERVAGAARA